MLSMLRVRCLLPAIAVAVLLGAAPLARGTESLVPWMGGPPPPLKLRDLAGKEVSLDDFKGRTVVVNFWATWCAPCVAEMPSLQRMRDELAPQGVEVIAVNLQENPGRIKPFVEERGIRFPVVRDHDGSQRKAWNVTVFPTTFVVTPERRIAWVGRGEIDWDDPRVKSLVRSAR